MKKRRRGEPAVRPGSAAAARLAEGYPLEFYTRTGAYAERTEEQRAAHHASFKEHEAARKAARRAEMKLLLPILGALALALWIKHRDGSA